MRGPPPEPLGAREGGSRPDGGAWLVGSGGGVSRACRPGYSERVTFVEGREIPPIRAVVLDVGETIVDESGEYGAWADWLGVPRHTFSAVMGAVIARGGDYRDSFQRFRPGFDLGTERKLRQEAGLPEGVREEDGLRWGEACALRRRRCDVLRSRVEVVESLAEISGRFHFGEPKTYARRWVRLPKFVSAMLAEHLQVSVPADPDALVFTAGGGTPLRNSNFRRRVWQPALSAAGLPEEVHLA
jgi:hypothetical protein